MDISSTGGISGPDPVEPKRIHADRIRPKSLKDSSDSVEISDHARFLAKLSEVAPMRLEKIEALRELIASGKYETPERIAGAVTKLLEELR